MSICHRKTLSFSLALALAIPAGSVWAQARVAAGNRLLSVVPAAYVPAYTPPPYHPPVQPAPMVQVQPLPTQSVPDPTAPAQVLGNTPYEMLPPAYKRYANEFVAVDELRVVNPWNGEVMRTSIQPRQGIYQRPLKREEFYRLIGGAELGREYADRESRRTRFIVGGAVTLSLSGVLAIVGGTMAMIAALSPTDPKTGRCPPYEATCFTQGSLIGFSVMAGVGVAGLISGMVVLFSGVAQKPDPVEPDEARRLAAGYNQSLRQQLGLTPSAPPPQAAPPAGTLPPAPAEAPTPPAFPPGI